MLGFYGTIRWNNLMELFYGIFRWNYMFSVYCGAFKWAHAMVHGAGVERLRHRGPS